MNDGWELIRVEENHRQKHNRYTFRSHEVYTIDKMKARKMWEVYALTEKEAWTELDRILK